MLTSITMVLIIGSVFFFALVIYETLGKGFRRYQEKYLVQSVGDLSNMFIFLDPGTVLVLNICTMGLLTVLGGFMLGPGVAVIGAVVGFFAPMLVVRRYRKRRIETFDKQLVEALQQMAGALKAGLTFQQAMEQISREAAPPLGQEFSLAVRELKVGLPLDEALVNLAARVGSDDLDLTVTSTNIAKQLGGNMAEMFETISGTIRERLRLEGKIKSITSQGKMQGTIVSMLPVAIGFVINLMRPDLMGPMLTTPPGWLLIAVAVVGIFLGWLMITRIVNIDV
jgi:tight adherence protein B